MLSQQQQRVVARTRLLASKVSSRLTRQRRKRSKVSSRRNRCRPSRRLLWSSHVLWSSHLMGRSDLLRHRRRPSRFLLLGSSHVLRSSHLLARDDTHVQHVTVRAVHGDSYEPHRIIGCIYGA